MAPELIGGVIRLAGAAALMLLVVVVGIALMERRRKGRWTHNKREVMRR